MAESYYLMSKDIGDGPYLLGKLSRIKKGEYQFRYMVNAPDFPYWFMQIPRLNDLDKTYQSQEVLSYIIYRIVPDQSEWASGILMQQNGISDYDEWELLVSLIEQHSQHSIDGQPFCDSNQLFYFYTEIPAQAHRFD
ncbi:MAG: hypothetical protein FWH40_04055 [Coriobacteriia bacterium]|nr:hypothetical protein [Coriobacteriia bacterium]